VNFLYFFGVAYGILVFFTGAIFKFVDFVAWVVAEHKRRKRSKRRGGYVIPASRLLGPWDDEWDPR
jgi:hypothetical protein